MRAARVERMTILPRAPSTNHVIVSVWCFHSCCHCFMIPELAGNRFCRFPSLQNKLFNPALFPLKRGPHVNFTIQKETTRAKYNSGKAKCWRNCAHLAAETIPFCFFRIFVFHSGVCNLFIRFCFSAEVTIPKFS